MPLNTFGASDRETQEELEQIAAAFAEKTL